MAKRAVIYGRVATVDQAKHDSSLLSQLEASRKYAEERGWKIVEEVADEGVSGATLDRPGLSRVREMVGAGQIDIVVLHRTDRLSRKMAHLLSLEEEFAKATVEVHCVLGNYKGSDVAQLVKMIRSACAEI
jgi:site-specific DNA recombinase